MSAGAPLSDEMRQHWTECDLKTEVGAVPRPRVVPFKSMRSEHFSMQLLVQARPPGATHFACPRPEPRVRTRAGIEGPGA